MDCFARSKAKAMFTTKLSENKTRAFWSTFILLKKDLQKDGGANGVQNFPETCSAIAIWCVGGIVAHAHTVIPVDVTTQDVNWTHQLHTLSMLIILLDSILVHFNCSSL